MQILCRHATTHVTTLVAKISIASLLLQCAAPGNALAQGAAWPIKPVRILIGYPPGAGSDIVTRLITPELTKAFGQTFVVDNRPGAAGNIAMELAARTPPDGYTLVNVPASITISQSLQRKPPFDLMKDFDAVAMKASVPFALVIHPSLPAKSIKELVAFTKARPGQLTYASTGTGSSPHLTGEMFKMHTGLDILHVPYKGTPQANTDIIAGQVTMMFSNMLSVTPHVKTGRLRALAVTSLKRSSAAPDVPTMVQAGVAGFEAGTWYVLSSPVGLPRDVIQRLNTEVNRIVQLPEVREKFAALGAEPMNGTPEQTTAFLRIEIIKWGKVVKASGTKVE
jgi:tripartite-type tricarboxylate transporter receptor subunit TctC